MVYARTRCLISLLFVVFTGCLGGQGGAPGETSDNGCPEPGQTSQDAKALEQYAGDYEGTGFWYADQSSPGEATRVELSLVVDGEVLDLECLANPARAARLHLRTEDGVDLGLAARITKQGEGAEVIWPVPGEDSGAPVSRGRFVFEQSAPDLLDARVEGRTLRSIRLVRSASE